MKNWLNKYFGFTKRELNGLTVLMGLLFLLFVTPFIYENFFSPQPIITNFEQNAIQQLTLIRQKDELRNDYHPTSNTENEVVVPTSLFKFDPNKIDELTWRKLGLSAKQAKSILNYRAKGGKFYKPSDLKKMYTISAKMFARLEPFLFLEENDRAAFSTTKKIYEVKSFTKAALIVVEVNGADTIALDKIKGIGAAFARRIAKYRDRLGGFYKKEQLMEVFGLDSSKFEEIKHQVEVDVSLIKKININIADFELLKNHPYLKYREINAIVQYRKQHGSYNGIADLKKLLILTPQLIEKIAPYLNFNVSP